MVDYKKFKIERLDPISPTFCASKWLSADFWLETGTTSSCHLPPPHKINLQSVETNLYSLHNTTEKLEQKSQMLAGLQPAGCSNCWQVENKDPETISERIVSSNDNHSDIDFATLTLSNKQVPKIITVAFDSLCNFTCSYCDATQSSSWATDLKINGPYKQIQGDQRNTYQRLGTRDKLNDQEFEFILSKFNEYILTNVSAITSIRCLGGEPLFSKNFWRFIDVLEKVDCSNINLIIVSNLSDSDRVLKLLTHKHKFKSIQFNVSIENIGARAEFIRTGLQWNKFENNLRVLLANNVKVTLLGTVSLIVLDGLIEFLDWYSTINSLVSLDLFRLRHPSFQALQVLPTKLKLQYAQQLMEWIETHSPNVQLTAQIKNIVTILNDDCIIYDNVDVDVLRASAKQFYKEYASRHSHNINDIFDYEMSNWLLN